MIRKSTLTVSACIFPGWRYEAIFITQHILEIVCVDWSHHIRDSGNEQTYGRTGQRLAVPVGWSPPG
jgi:hypothetical protein